MSISPLPSIKNTRNYCKCFFIRLSLPPLIIIPINYACHSTSVQPIIPGASQLFGRLSLTHSTPYPSCAFGHRSYPGTSRAPRLRYAFTFSPYRYGSLPLTIPHSMRRAALPVTKAPQRMYPYAPGILLRAPGQLSALPAPPDPVLSLPLHKGKPAPFRKNPHRKKSERHRQPR